MKNYYANPKTGAVIQFDQESNEIVELVKLGGPAEIAEQSGGGI